MATFALMLPSHAAGTSPIRSVHVSRSGQTYVCDAVMLAPVSPAVAWEVLTDFEHMAQWVPNVRESRVVKHDGNSVIIEQRGLAVFGLLSFPYTTRREIEMNKPLTVRSTQVEGSLRRFASLMALEPEGNFTRLSYHLELVPGVLAGTVVSESFLEHEIAEQFGAIIGEMARRAR
jgi:carbon monoxide dehydrogenase subunit G